MLAERVQEWTQQWKAEGREEGREEGRKEGEITLLTRQLERRFGPLDETVKGRLERADAEQRLRWGERLLVADTLEAVFQDNGHASGGV
jgi:flagellar biosynthesis/type III secretory pathway protein FliH